MQRADDALYWCERMINDGASEKRIARLLFKSALRDSMSVHAMLEAESNLQTLLTPHGVVLARERQDSVLDLALTQKLWSCDYGRKVAAIICASEEDESYRRYTDAELPIQLTMALGDPGRFSDVISIVHEVLYRRKQFKLSPYLEIVGALLDWGRSHPDYHADLAAGLLSRLPGDPQKFGVAEDTLMYLVATWAVTGSFGQEECNPMIRSVAEDAARGRLRKQFHDGSWEAEPLWAGSDDRRFESTWDGYANMALMFEQHGRIDPRDDGALFHVKNGRWSPVIREEDGVFLVQSQKETRVFYEVNLSILSCTCKDFIRRHLACKHVDAAREYWETQCPFVVQ